MEILEMPIVSLRHPGITASGMFDEMESLTPSDVSSAPPLKDQISFFRPSVQLELENEDPKSAKALYIRGWMIDTRYIFIFQKCLPALSSLHSINLWNVGLTGSTFAALLVILRQCYSLRSVVLDGNPIAGHPYYQLLSEDSPFQNLTLRNNKIDDAGAKLIGEALSTIKKSNKTLMTLNLSFNHITDVGAGYIADGLRLNRTLVWLSLASNQIGDQGATKLAEPSLFRRPDSKSDRSASQIGSNTALDKLDKTGKGTKGTSKKKEKRDPVVPEKLLSNTQIQQKKDEARTGRKGSLVTDVRLSRSKMSRLGKDKRVMTQEQEVPEFLNPLVDFVEHQNGDIYLSGNITLMSINLTRNKITEVGLRAFHTAVQTQIQNARLSSDGRATSGLLRLAISRNLFPGTCETYTQLQKLMLARDPVSRQRMVCSPSPGHHDPQTQS
ncbi:leucine-rich repeat-containing protein 71 isoform X2 [Hemiscyllium ocellatum]|uniref:leucine-rich repeat-containing protein 71 isoform X2 n=1 Tax=Hemiscyllium ocellatum TaxID=170820 RepID=UPI002966630D|nr:leucine-rich repeat-containing protein 71 isoform X2 [Hemiscyllium ocellatum]